ncbi:hypothetical protein MINTMi27_15750 [Mycobacterium intracellulare]|nr:hypothetical protein MINTMi27_15750 [Mycobacterium intracellulare]
MTDWRTYRRIIDAYRSKLMEVDLEACDEVDFKMSQSRDTKWVCDDRPIDLDRWMSAREMAERFGFKPHNIRDWARRHPDQIHPRKVDGKVLFLVREVLQVNA